MTNPDSDALVHAVTARELLYSHADVEWRAGSAEPWIANLVAALVAAHNPRHAIEIGAFEGYTTTRLLRALRQLPHVTQLTVCEIDRERANVVHAALERIDAPTVQTRIVVEDSHAWLPTLAPDSVDFAWIDGNHEQLHVAHEIEFLWPALRVGGIAAFHDVFGVCDLQKIVHAYGGYSLDLPRLGPAGGLGLIQKRA